VIAQGVALGDDPAQHVWLGCHLPANHEERGMDTVCPKYIEYRRR
jgi:hypothetical protein